MYYTLAYSVYGENEWRSFNTDARYWVSSRGRSVADTFETFSEAEETVFEWFENRATEHYPVAIFSGRAEFQLARPLAIFQGEKWKYTGAHQQLVRTLGGGGVFVVVV